MKYRVTQEFTITGDPPSKAATDQLVEQFRATAPDAGAVVAIGLGRMQVAMTFQARDPAGAVDVAKTTAGAVLGRRPTRVDVEPAD
jgi:hypothetical protein